MASRLDVEWAILSLVEERGKHSSACPSEVARALSATAWRELMPLVREVAFELQQQGRLNVTQAGVSVLDASALRGPIRLGLSGNEPH